MKFVYFLRKLLSRLCRVCLFIYIEVYIRSKNNRMVRLEPYCSMWTPAPPGELQARLYLQPLLEALATVLTTETSLLGGIIIFCDMTIGCDLQ